MGTPMVAGVLTPQQIGQTAESIAATQLASGALPWFAGGHVDPWDHVQAAMGLTAAGHLASAQRAFEWSRDFQRSDGSWAIRYDDDIVTDPHTDSNFCAYLATGVWHHWLVSDDREFIRAMWPTVERGLDAALKLQRSDGAIAWASADGVALPDALITSNASIHLSLRCGIALAELVGKSRPDWELAAARLRHVLDQHPEVFEAKTRYSMDWYYPVLGGALPAEIADARIDQRWDDFVVDGLGCRCVTPNAWVTGAETCELVLALDVIGRTDQAREQLAAMQHLREEDGSYWTGLVYDDGVRWPVEQSTWTAATVILAADALSRTSPGNGVFRGEGLPQLEWRISDGCTVGR